MHFEGSQTIAAPIEKVWQLLMDPQQIGPCLPGFQGIEVEDAQHFKALVGVGVGFVKAKFTMDVSVVDQDPPTKATARAHGVAPISAVDVTSTMTLHDEGSDTTQLQWAADVVVSGTLASLGARLLTSTARKMTGQFFNCIARKLEEPAGNTGS
ncbi:MAG: carbon monoxide dehydrogenase [Chloroflexi bacterium]|jgi:carbon monoxide dehydrogenase subunit G|nr:carbon monoxide dehydrogenase [Chloroflexota bacterium]